jgi:hypothetical protein
MKRALIVPVLLLLTAAASAESRLFISLGAGLMRPLDPGYRQIYGSEALLPEVSAALRLYKGFCLTAAAGQSWEEGKTPDLGLETKASQGFISIGLGYLLRVSERLCVGVDAGIAGMSFSEEAMGFIARGKGPGYKAEAGLFLMEEDGRAFLGLKLGYLSARVLGPEQPPADSQSIKLGGPKIALCFGLQLFAAQ